MQQSLSYLELSGAPSHLRYLIERLRKYLPGLPVVVGIWREGEAMLTDAGMQRSMGAEDYTATLGEAVTACIGRTRS
jgi:hypothetical protein